MSRFLGESEPDGSWPEQPDPGAARADETLLLCGAYHADSGRLSVPRRGGNGRAPVRSTTYS
ncbi:hypothetical protein ALMP_58960 [Streptomyces sp. A012304]|nr:hypothetical protein ALMP_58960 [Streptomyces sp. A012304]